MAEIESFRRVDVADGDQIEVWEIIKLMSDRSIRREWHLGSRDGASYAAALARDMEPGVIFATYVRLCFAVRKDGHWVPRKDVG